MVVDHHHFIIICLGNLESLAVFIDLVGQELTDCAVTFDIRHGPEEGLFLRLILQGDHEQLIMAMWIRVLDTTVHAELQRRCTDLDARSDFNPFVCLVCGAIAELGETDDVDSDLIDLHFLDRFGFRGEFHCEGCDDIFRGRGAMIKRHDRHQLIVFREFDTVSLRESGLGHFKSGSTEEERLTGAGDAGFGVIDHQNMVQIISWQFLSIDCRKGRLEADQILVLRQLKVEPRHGIAHVAFAMAGRKIDGAECKGRGVLSIRD